MVVHPSQKNDGTSSLVSVHWSNHFKGLYNQKKVPLAVMKMADNHLRNVYCRHQLKHGRAIFPYFDCHANNRASDLIQAYDKVKNERAARKLTYIDSETEKKRDASNQALPDMSFRE